MKFGPVAMAQAKGAILAHAAGGLKKGRVLGAEDIALLEAQGLTQVTVARLGRGDVAEDEAARLISIAIAGPGTTAQAPFTGRANLYAEAAGLVLVDEALLLKLNSLHEAITIATLKSHDVVGPRAMLATVKIIPYAVPATALKKALVLLKGKRLIRLARFQPRKAGLIITQTPATKPTLIAKSEAVMAQRLARLGASLGAVAVVPHEAGAVAKALKAQKAQGLSPLLVFGASAIADRADVVPAGLSAAKGSITRLGLPVDPGNLLMLGQLGGVPVVGVPTCARSPKLNGFDWILSRLCAGLQVSSKDAAALGAGGLLAEIASRPQPREGGPTPPQRPRIAAVILAGGQSTRMGGNKLLAELHGRPLLAQTLARVQAAGVDELVVVTGHMAEAVRHSLAGENCRFVHNPDYAQGLATSIKAGLAALSGVDAAFICLGDMPLIRPEDLQRMMAAFDAGEGRSIIAPALGRKLGNPVLWGQAHFPSLMALEGDRGARSLLEAQRESVTEIAVDHEGIMLDADTPAALEEIRQQAR